MITAEELIRMAKQEKQDTFKLGTVVELFAKGTAKIRFDGEETPSEKEYSYLASYKPSVGDRVLLASVAGTYVIMDKIMYKETIEEDIGDGSGSFTSLVVEGETKTGTLDVTGNIATNSLDVTEQSNLNKLTASDDVEFRKNLNVGETANLKNVICGRFAHNTGAYFGVFGKNPISQKSCSTLYSSSDLSAVINKVNEVINHLKDYGFFR